VAQLFSLGSIARDVLAAQRSKYKTMKIIQVVGLLGTGFVVGALTIGLWFGDVGRHQTETPTMTHDTLVQQAIGQLAQNGVKKDTLENPQVRDATVVYFKIHPDSNVRMVLDSHTGEQISAQFSDHMFLKEYLSQ
jgi:hypothetical protein